MYEPHYEEEPGGGGFLIGLLCGTALGAAIGLMFAPKAGSEFRQRLYESTGDIRRKAYETYDQASEQVNNMVVEGPSGRRSRPRGVRNRPAVGDRPELAATGRTSDFGSQNRPGVSDFNSATRTDRRRLGSHTLTEQRQRAEGTSAFCPLRSSLIPLIRHHCVSPSVRHSPCTLARVCWINAQNRY